MSDDDWVRRTLHDAVDDIRPEDALDVIRSRTTRPAARRAGWAWATGGAAIGLAATVTAVAVLGQLGGSDDDTGGIATTTPTPSVTASNFAFSMPVYFVGDTPAGPRLYREFARINDSDAVSSAVDLALGGHSSDPDYKTPFTRVGTVHGTAELEDGLITVHLEGPDDLGQLPDGLDLEDAEAGVQQLIYTAQGALFTAGGEKESLSDTLVRFTIDGEPADTVLGVPTADPLPAAPRSQTIAPVSISQPADGQVIPKAATLRGFSYGSISWELRQGDTIVAEGRADNTKGAGVYSEYAVGLTVVPPGDYLLVVREADPTGGAEGPGLVKDDKRITIR